jgi:predicted ester cyclase
LKLLNEKNLDVIDIIQLRDGKIVGHWGILDMHSLTAQLQ